MGSLNPKHAKILEGRGLDLEILSRFDVSSVSAGRRGGEWIKIPYLRGGEIVNHKFRTIEGEKGFRQDKGGVKCFWNGDVITDVTLKDQPLIITEGEMDAFVAIQAGFSRVVSVPEGAPATEVANTNGSKYSFVADMLAELRAIPTIILATDGDSAGVALMNDLASILGRARCRFLRYPMGAKDLNEILQRYRANGLDKVRETINKSEWMRVHGLYRMSELPPINPPAAMSLGDKALDTHVKIRRGDFQVISGIPAMGKSTWINEMAERLAKNHGAVSAFFSPEQRTQIDHKRALRQRFIRKPPLLWEPDEIEAADAWIDKYFSFIIAEDDVDATLEWVLETAAAAVIRHGATAIWLDPWNELEHQREPGMTLTEYTGWAIKQMKKFATRMGVHFGVAAHPAKLLRDRKTGKYPIPTLYDISDSAHWFNKPDLGSVVHITEGGTTLLQVQKVRYTDVNGRRGDIPMEFLKYEGRYRVREDLMEGTKE